MLAAGIYPQIEHFQNGTTSLTEENSEDVGLSQIFGPPPPSSQPRVIPMLHPGQCLQMRPTGSPERRHVFPKNAVKHGARFNTQLGDWAVGPGPETV